VGEEITEPRPRFLAIRLSSIGDIVHALPAVAALGLEFPEAEISWVIEQRYASLLEGNPFVHRVLTMDTLGWRPRLLSAETRREMVRGLFALREFAYEAVIDFQGLIKSAIIARLSRSRRRLGLAHDRLREPLASVFYTERVTARGCTHVVEENLALVERLGARPTRWYFPLPQSPIEEHRVEQRLRALSAENFMIINPGGGWMAKCWAPANYAKLIKRLGAGCGLGAPGPGSVLLTGSPGEEPLVREILESADSPWATYFPSTLTEFIALARRAKLFLGGDTGPLHLAAAVGTPIVALYGPTDPARNGPFSRADITLSNRGPINHTRRARRPAHLEGVPVESVLAAVQERWVRAYG